MAAGVLVGAELGGALAAVALAAAGVAALAACFLGTGLGGGLGRDAAIAEASSATARDLLVEKLVRSLVTAFILVSQASVQQPCRLAGSPAARGWLVTSVRLVALGSSSAQLRFAHAMHNQRPTQKLVKLPRTSNGSVV